MLNYIILQYRILAELFNHDKIICCVFISLICFKHSCAPPPPIYDTYITAYSYVPPPYMIFIWLQIHTPSPIYDIYVTANSYAPPYVNRRCRTIPEHIFQIHRQTGGKFSNYSKSRFCKLVSIIKKPVDSGLHDVQYNWKFRFDSLGSFWKFRIVLKV